jgi:undecaprenyl-diphosphatase
MFVQNPRNQRNSKIFSYIAAALLVVAAGMAVMMIRHYLLYGGWAVDSALLNYSMSIRTPLLDAFFRAITATGETLPVILCTLLMAICLLLKGKPVSAGFTGFYMLGVWLLNELLKRVLERPRPPFDLHLAHAAGYSLPSGHSMNFIALVLLGLYMLWSFSERKDINSAATLFFIPYSLLMGLSRVYLHVHYFSDVITGWCVGIAWAAACTLLHGQLLTKKAFL